MHTLSSASRTCMAEASAVECTATVATPSSRHARRTRSATSPRFAIRTLPNTCAACLLEDEQRLAVLDRRRVAREDPGHPPRAGRADRVHDLHRLDHQQRLAFLDHVA